MYNEKSGSFISILPELGIDLSRVLVRVDRLVELAAKLDHEIIAAELFCGAMIVFLERGFRHDGVNLDTIEKIQRPLADFVGAFVFHIPILLRIEGVVQRKVRFV